MVLSPLRGSTGRPQQATTPLASAGVLASGLVVVLSVALYGYVVPLTPGRIRLRSAQLIDRTALWRAVRRVVGALVPQTAGAVTASVLVGTVLAFAAYAAAVALLWRRAPSRSLLTIVLGTGALVVVAATLALPNASTDIYNYLVTARVLTAHGANPVLTAPDTFRGDPLWAFAGHRYTSRPDNKLGVWVLFSLPPTVLGGGDPVRSMLLLRAATGLVAIVNTVLVALVLRRTAPAHVCAGTALYAWNPIVAVHSAGKTDTLMVAFFLGSVLLSLHARERLATLAAAASALVKPLSLPFTATLLLGQVRRGPRPGRELVVRALLALALAVGVYQVFGRDPLMVVRQLLGSNGPGGGASPVVSVVILLGFVAGTAWTALRQDGTVERYLRSSVPLALYAAALLPYVGFAWYLLVPLALIALVREPVAAAAVVAVSLVHGLRNALDDAHAGTLHVTVLSHTAVLLLVLPLLALAWFARRAVAGTVVDAP